VRSRVLRERRARGQVVLTVAVGEDELLEIARAGYAEAVSPPSRVSYALRAGWRDLKMRAFTLIQKEAA
jgi:hypothetical protein